jgi:sec-independent protein translocase protein TatC
MAGPLLILYECSILVAALFGKKPSKPEGQDDEEDDADEDEDDEPSSSASHEGNAA